ncbi:MAG: hypothetical protein JW908_09495 [Anaerolineales bacterium]|nr:hypothetical protein [Anaerolineales bacterium]
MTPSNNPGLIVLFGSGETSASGRKIFDHVMRSLPASPAVSLLETPAGFELNSAQVIGRVGEFLRKRLQNYNPQINIVPARKRGTPFSPDDPKLVQPLLSADMIFMGPGSPTYAVKQLYKSLTWDYLLARHDLGATLALASAATVAFGAYCLPVYEIYKVGEEPHWIMGLDFFNRYGLSLTFMPHWNNNDGGQELDTRYCFMGALRFGPLFKMLPPETSIIGLDEKTGLVIDLGSGDCEVVGLGSVTIIYEKGEADFEGQTKEKRFANTDLFKNKSIRQFDHGQSFSLVSFKSFRHPAAGDGIPDDIWDLAICTQNNMKREKEKSKEELLPPTDILELVNQREMARQDKDWKAADRLREQIHARGWVIFDTPQGPMVEAIANQHI